jgi:hypothetical protein
MIAGTNGMLEEDGLFRAASAVPEAALGGDTAGALNGFVVGVKDVIAVAGMPTRAGSPHGTPDPVAADAPAVTRWRPPPPTNRSGSPAGDASRAAHRRARQRFHRGHGAGGTGSMWRFTG